MMLVKSFPNLGLLIKFVNGNWVLRKLVCCQHAWRWVARFENVIDETL